MRQKEEGYQRIEEHILRIKDLTVTLKSAEITPEVKDDLKNFFVSYEKLKKLEIGERPPEMEKILYDAHSALLGFLNRAIVLFTTKTLSTRDEFEDMAKKVKVVVSFKENLNRRSEDESHLRGQLENIQSAFDHFTRLFDLKQSVTIDYLFTYPKDKLFYLHIEKNSELEKEIAIYIKCWADEERNKLSGYIETFRNQNLFDTKNEEQLKYLKSTDTLMNTRLRWVLLWREKLRELFLVLENKRKELNSLTNGNWNAGWIKNKVIDGFYKEFNGLILTYVSWGPYLDRKDMRKADLKCMSNSFREITDILSAKKFFTSGLSHRGFKQFFARLGELILSVLTLGIFNLSAKLQSGTFRLFDDAPTDSEIKINQVLLEIKDFIINIMFSINSEFESRPWLLNKNKNPVDERLYNRNLIFKEVQKELVETHSDTALMSLS